MALRKILDRGDPTPSAYEAARQRWADARTEVRELTERLEDAKAAMRLHGYDAVRGERLTLAPLRERATRFLAGRHLSERQIRRAVEDLEDLLAAALARLGARPTLRQRDGAPFVTDGGNLIFDCDFGPLADPAATAAALKATPGVVEHGLFIGIVETVIVAGSGGVKTYRRGE